MNNKIIILLVCITAAAFLFYLWATQQPPPFAKFPEIKPIQLEEKTIVHEPTTIEGVIVNSDGTPIAGAWIFVASKRTLRSVQSIEDGSFHLESADSGELQITASALGYESFSLTTDAKNGVAKIVLKQLTSFAENLAEPEQGNGSVIGSLTSKTCNPTGLAVILLPNSSWSSTGYFRSVLDTQGFFQISNVPPGQYELLVLSALRDFDLQSHYAQQTVNIEKDKETSLAIEVSCTKLEGTVLAHAKVETLPAPAAPRPFAKAVIHVNRVLEDQSRHGMGTLSPRSDGSFALTNLPIGDYEITIFATGFTALQRTVTLQDEDRLKLKFVLNPQ